MFELQYPNRQLGPDPRCLPDPRVYDIEDALAAIAIAASLDSLELAHLAPSLSVCKSRRLEEIRDMVEEKASRCIAVSKMVQSEMIHQNGIPDADVVAFIPEIELDMLSEIGAGDPMLTLWLYYLAVKATGKALSAVLP